MQLFQGESALPETQEVSELMRISSLFKHSGQAVLEGALVALLVVGLMAGTAFAARGGGGGKGSGGATTSTLTRVMVEDGNANGLPNHLDTITYSVSTTATDVPMVGLRCYQGSTFMYDGYIALYEASWLTKEFLLDSSPWNASLGADCTARLFYYDNRGREKVLTTSSFVVTP